MLVLSVLVCLLCGDPLPPLGHVLGPLLSAPGAAAAPPRSLLVPWGGGVAELLLSSYHGAAAFRDDLLHGLVLVLATARRASLACLR